MPEDNEVKRLEDVKAEAKAEAKQVTGLKGQASEDDAEAKKATLPGEQEEQDWNE